MISVIFDSLVRQVEVVVGRARYTREGILTRRAARRIQRPYAGRLASVIFEAWETWNALGTAAPAVRMKLGRTARAMNVSDFIKVQIIDHFNSVKGCSVVMEYGRPVLTFAGGDLKIHLGKIDLSRISPPRNDRQLRIWTQADATSPALDEMPSGTWAKCGYVLDSSETSVRGIHVVCNMDGAQKWVLDFPVPLPRPSTAGSTPLATSEITPAKIVSANQSTGAQQTSGSSE